jgi:hypothetical protein
MNYGIRQSVKNKNVGKVGDGQDILFSSELCPFSVFASGEYPKHYPGAVEGTPVVQEETITHNLGYKPIYFVFGGSGEESMKMPFFFTGGTHVRIYANENSFTIEVTNASPFEADVWFSASEFDYTMYWMIFSEPNLSKLPTPKTGEIVSTYYNKDN